MTFSVDWVMFGMIIFAGVLMTYMWRFAGVLAASRLSTDSEILRWVRAVATALIAGIVAKLVVAPPGALAEIPDIARYTAFVTGGVVFFLTRYNVPVGVIAGIIVLLGMTLVLEYPVF